MRVPAKIPPIEIDWAAVRAAFAPWLRHCPDFNARFARIRAQHAQLQAEILARVKSWECYSFPSHEIDPSYYLLGGSRPGRRLKTDPGPNARAARYGLDADGHKVIERWPNEFSTREWLWKYHADRIDGLAVTVGKPSGSEISPVNVESLFFENGQPVCFFRRGSQGVHVRLFQYENGRIVKVFLANGNDRSGADPERGWAYQFADAAYDEKGNARVRWFDQFGNGCTHTYKTPKRAAAKMKVPVLDLRKDVADVVASLAKAVRQFAAKQAKSAGPVSGIGLGFFPFENPEIIIQFDTRPTFEPDGNWSHPEFARLKRARWAKFVDACADAGGKGVVIDTNGNRHEIAEVEKEERFVGWLGEALVAALKAARTAGVFNQLKKAARCEFGVEEAGDGEFGWPRYEDRGDENLV